VYVCVCQRLAQESNNHTEISRKTDEKKKKEREGNRERRARAHCIFTTHAQNRTR